jgi:hypothetical protein
MKKRLTISAIVVALMVTLAPVSADATGEGGSTGVVAVFTGNASVTPGLCIPGNAPGCVGPAEAVYNFTIPGDPAPMPAICQAAGLFEDQDATGECDLIANGTLDGITTPEPACGNATGASSATETNTVTFAGDTRTHSHSFLTTAGSVVPVTGNIDDADTDTTAGPNDHQVVALVQAFPVTDTGTIPCLTAPASTFIAVGIAVAA